MLADFMPEHDFAAEGDFQNFASEYDFHFEQPPACDRAVASTGHSIIIDSGADIFCIPGSSSRVAEQPVPNYYKRLF